MTYCIQCMWCKQNWQVKEMQLTQGEKIFLQNLFVNEKRIEEEKLYAYQIRVLEQYRMAMSYLNRKYPDTEFEIVMGNPQNKMNSFAEFVFKKVGEDDIFQLSISKMNDEYMTIDNYYGLQQDLLLFVGHKK